MNEYLGILATYLKTFLVGGLICVIAQILINTTKITAAKILVGFLLAGIVLQALGLYQFLVDFAKSGATIPISGFGYAIAKGAMEGAQKGLFGAITGGIKAGAAGITAAIVFGYLFAVIFKPKSKKN